MAMFGIPISARGYTPRADTSGEGGESAEDDPSFDGAAGFSDSYGAQVDVDPLVLSIGDLVELEPGYWVTVDEEPEEDPMDPTSVLLCWRDDEDNTGAVGLNLGERVTSRRASYETEGAP
jgi:hypothetical protein